MVERRLDVDTPSRGAVLPMSMTEGPSPYSFPYINTTGRRGGKRGDEQTTTNTVKATRIANNEGVGR